jgi:hypothetical protein
MEILENLDEWFAEYSAGWLAHFKDTGEKNWRIYNRPRNSIAPGGPSIKLEESRLMLVSTAGGYLARSQEPFDDKNALGDYTVRTFSSRTPLDDLAFSHAAYNHAAVEEDPQVLVPLRHLEDMVQEGSIGELTPSVISICGYMPDASRLVKETIPLIVQIARKQEAQAALLVPA